MWLAKVVLTPVSLSGVFVVAYQLVAKCNLDIRAESPTSSVVEVTSSPLPTQSPMPEATPLSPSPQASPRFSPSVRPSPLASAIIMSSPRPRHDEREGEDD